MSGHLKDYLFNSVLALWALLLAENLFREDPKVELWIIAVTFGLPIVVATVWGILVKEAKSE